MAQSEKGAKIAILQVSGSDSDYRATRADLNALIDELDGNFIKNRFVDPVMDPNDSIDLFKVKDFNDIGSDYSRYDAVFVFTHGDANTKIGMLVDGQMTFKYPTTWDRILDNRGINCAGVDGCIDGIKNVGGYTNPFLRNDNLMWRAKPSIMYYLKQK